jgi:3-(3-hydroxy-phenyl)propionate hydroxylase
VCRPAEAGAQRLSDATNDTGFPLSYQNERERRREMTTHTNPVYAYQRSRDQDVPAPRRPVIVVGAGPVGLAAAIDLAQCDVPVLVLDEDDTVSVGSRAICYSKRALEILDRLGCGDRIAGKGVEWNVGRVFFRDEQVYEFDLLPERGHRRPAFINLQQYHLEECLVERVAELPRAEVRWRNKVVAVTPRKNDVLLRVATPEGDYELTCEWLIACDGSKSALRSMLGLEAPGQVFRDRFLILDIHMKSNFPAERWFWFDPPFHAGQSALLHRQADDVWRIDFQLGWDADPDVEKQPARIIPRLRAMLDDSVEFDIEWASVYTFACRRMQRFRHGRVLFAGDAAHVVSPFGARGANSGFQDTDNLVWKLKLVLDGSAPERLLDTYDAERIPAADENLLNSTRATDFITPKSPVSRTFRDAVLALAKHHPFARKLVNSGRLSLPHVYRRSPLSTPDRDGETFAGAMVPGAPAVDAPIADARAPWLLDYLHDGFTLLAFGDTISPEAAEALSRDAIPCRVVQVGGEPAGDRAVVRDRDGLLRDRYDGRPGTCYLLRPDQHVCARWRRFDVEAVRAAIRRATSND